MRKAIITGIAVGAIAAAALLGPAGAFASSPAATRASAATRARATTLHLTAHFVHAALVDAAPQGPSAGDQQVVAGTLLRGTKAVGRFGFVCEFLTTGRNANEECTGTGRLSDGSITAQGFSRQSDDDHTWAVVGGTGAYRGASGQIAIHDVNDSTSDLTIEIG